MPKNTETAAIVSATTVNVAKSYTRTVAKVGANGLTLVQSLAEDLRRSGLIGMNDDTAKQVRAELREALDKGVLSKVVKVATAAAFGAKTLRDVVTGKDSNGKPVTVSAGTTFALELFPSYEKAYTALTEAKERNESGNGTATAEADTGKVDTIALTSYIARFVRDNDAKSLSTLLRTLKSCGENAFSDVVAERNIASIRNQQADMLSGKLSAK